MKQPHREHARPQKTTTATERHPERATHVTSYREDEPRDVIRGGRPGGGDGRGQRPRDICLTGPAGWNCGKAGERRVRDGAETYRGDTVVGEQGLLLWSRN